jgi:hypothetical protein
MATEKIKIARIAYLTKNKEGEPLVNKQGKPFTKILLDTTDGRTMSGFKNQSSANWEEGMEVDVEVSEREYNGKTYLNFATQPVGAVDLSEVNQKLDKILTLLQKNETF